MKLSIVSTLYHSADHIAEFVERTTSAAKEVADDFEIILVNDGSPDDSLKIALGIQKANAHLHIIDLSRNFGHHRALMTGLTYAKGARVFIIDSDLEERPELLCQWWKLLDEEPDLDVVYGVQESRQGKPFEVLSGHIFYWLINALSPVKLNPNSIVSRLMTARYVRELLRHTEKELYLFGIMAATGFRQKGIPVNKPKKGTTTYTLIKRFSLFLNALTSFSNYPLYFIFHLGLSVTVFATAYMVFLVGRWALDPSRVLLGWTSVIVSIWFVGGVMLTSLGVMGIYLAKIFGEVKKRPLAIVRNSYPSETE